MYIPHLPHPILVTVSTYFSGPFHSLPNFSLTLSSPYAHIPDRRFPPFFRYSPFIPVSASRLLSFFDLASEHGFDLARARASFLHRPMLPVSFLLLRSSISPFCYARTILLRIHIIYVYTASIPILRRGEDTAFHAIASPVLFSRHTRAYVYEDLRFGYRSETTGLSMRYIPFDSSAGDSPARVFARGIMRSSCVHIRAWWDEREGWGGREEGNFPWRGRGELAGEKMKSSA